MVSTTPLGWLRAGAGLKSVKYSPTQVLEERFWTGLLITKKTPIKTAQTHCFLYMALPCSVIGLLQKSRADNKVEVGK